MTVDEIERAPAQAVAAVGNRRRTDTTGADRAPRLQQQHIQRLPGTPAIEDVAGPNCELVGEPVHQLFVDALELDAIDRAFVDRYRENA